MSHTPPSPTVVRSALLGLAGLITLGTGAMAATTSTATSPATDADVCSLAPAVVTEQERSVVLRLFVGGGFVPDHIAWVESPVFTLYSDGLAVFRGEADLPTLREPWPAFGCAYLTPDQVADLMAYALTEGGLGEARERYSHQIVDLASATFEILVDGDVRKVVVEAFGFDEGAPDQEARARLTALAATLSDFDGWLAARDVEAGSYLAPSYRVLIGPAWGEPAPEPVAWPWLDLALEDFEGDEMARYGLLAAEQVAQLIDVPSGGQALIMVASPDGEVLSVSVRPLLPDELARLAA